MAWNQLSTAYITSPRLILDEAVIDTPALSNEEPNVIFSKDDKESEIDRLSSDVETPDRAVEKHNQAFDSQPVKAESQRRRCRDMLMLFQDNKNLKEMEEDLGRILITEKNMFLQMEGSQLNSRQVYYFKRKPEKLVELALKRRGLNVPTKN